MRILTVTSLVLLISATGCGSSPAENPARSGKYVVAIPQITASSDSTEESATPKTTPAVTAEATPTGRPGIEEDSEDGGQGCTDESLAQAQQAADEPSPDRYWVCHVPGGDVKKGHWLSLPAPAAAYHLARHDLDFPEFP